MVGSHKAMKTMYVGTFIYNWWKMGLTVDLFHVLHLLRSKYNQNGRAYHYKAPFP